MKIEKISKPEQLILSKTWIVGVEEIATVLGPTFMELAHYIQEQQAVIESTPFVCYKNMDEQGNVDATAVELEVGFPIDRIISETDVLKCYSLPSYHAVTARFIGPYEDLTAPYLEMLAAIQELGGTFLHKSYEYYLSDEEIPEDQQETLLELPYQL